jgi:hypothetical protein
MPQFGRNDQAVTANSTTTAESTSGAPLGTYTAVKGAKTGNTTITISAANADFGNTSSGSKAAIDSTMYQNDTPGAFLSGMSVGVHGVAPAAMQNNITTAVQDRPAHAGWVIRRAGTGPITSAVFVTNSTSNNFANGETITVSNATAVGLTNATLTIITGNVTGASNGSVVSLQVTGGGYGFANANVAACTFVRQAYVSAITYTLDKYVSAIATTVATNYNNNSILVLTSANQFYQSVWNISTNAAGAIGASSNTVVSNVGAFPSGEVTGGLVLTIANAGGGAIQGNSSVTAFTPTLSSVAGATVFVNNSIISTIAANSAQTITTATALLTTNATGGLTGATLANTNIGLFVHGMIQNLVTVSVTLPAGNTTANVYGPVFVPTFSNSQNGNVTVTLGGRAGRVHTETLIAMGSLGQQAASYGTATTANSSAASDTYYSQ